MNWRQSFKRNDYDKYLPCMTVFPNDANRDSIVRIPMCLLALYLNDHDSKGYIMQQTGIWCVIWLVPLTNTRLKILVDETLNWGSFASSCFYYYHKDIGKWLQPISHPSGKGIVRNVCFRYLFIDKAEHYSQHETFESTQLWSLLVVVNFGWEPFELLDWNLTANAE